MKMVRISSSTLDCAFDGWLTISLEEEEEVDELEDEPDDLDEAEGSYQDQEGTRESLQLFREDFSLILSDAEFDAFLEPWGWEGEEPPLPRIHHHHNHGHNHHHHHYPVRGPPGWATITGIMPSRIPMQPYRVPRTQVPAHGADDGTNPLLIRQDRSREAHGNNLPRGHGIDAFTDWVHDMEPLSTGHWLSMDSPVSFMNAIMQAIGGQGGPAFGVINRPDGIHVHVDRRAVLPNRIQDIFGLGRSATNQARSRGDPSQAVGFALETTKGRWQEEARVLFSNSYVEKTQHVVNSLLKAMVPPAIEDDKKIQKHLEEARVRREEERAERERQERIAREEEEKERRRREEEENAKREEERQQREAERRAAGEAVEPMSDVQAEEASSHTEGGAGTTETARRVYVNFRGERMDITDLEIDPEYLEALPEDLREEVIMQQIAEHRSQAVATGAPPTGISQEFLDALPPDIREELLQEEIGHLRRSGRDEMRRQARADDEGGVHMLATLEPTLRESILAEQPDEVLATLGPEIISEARAALGGRRMRPFSTGDRGRVSQSEVPAGESGEEKKAMRRQVVQMLDKTGVATLLRLMFMPLQGSTRTQLNDVLHYVSENRQNRVEIISLLLSILQDGTGDMTAIERSFSQLSLRAKTPSSQKTPQSAAKRMSSSSFQAPAGVNSEVTPLLVVQQCLGTFAYLSGYNPHVAWFFLTEHESSSALKPKASRKGKSKESRASKFAINALLSLLDRKLIVESPNCMEQLSALLSTITQPLGFLLRREKESLEAKSKQQESAEAKDRPLPSSEVAESAAASGGDTTMIDAANDAAAAPATEGPVDEGQQSKASETKDKEKALSAKTSEDKHKRRTMEPPLIPDENLKLVVLILSARECNGKTFRDTLSTINNLSAIPGAKDVFGNELVRQARTLAATILSDLDELLSNIRQAHTGTDMQGLALSKFSPPSSDQAKLLRVLTALDYLFDPNRVDRNRGSEPETVTENDILDALYESSTFGPLWTKLSDCLTAVRQKEDMLNVATILLPLIEALMVVCKNTALKDAALARNSREGSVSAVSVDPNVSVENLFFKFTEDHRKILNELVRQNPRLMSGTFSLLVKNPKVLDFDNKRNYFNRRLHVRGPEARHHYPPLQITVHRDQCFLDSFKALNHKKADELKYGKLNVRFQGEEGVDAGGVTREWFHVLARGMFNPDYALFVPVASDRTTFHPNRLSSINRETANFDLQFLRFIGRIIGKALYEGRVLDCHFSRAVYKCMLGKAVSIKDMETLDLDYYKSLLWMLENDITDIITETFALEIDAFGETQVIDLVENGRNIPVTQENKEEYVQKVVEYRLIKSIKEQLDSFLKGTVSLPALFFFFFFFFFGGRELGMVLIPLKKKQASTKSSLPSSFPFSMSRNLNS